MSKVTYTDDGMNFDGDLDFDFNTQPKKMADMSRREIVKEAASGFYEGAKGELASVQKWRRSLEKSLPKGFSQSWDAYDETSQSVSDLYNHAEKEIKPLLGQLAFKIDSFVPENLESIKKFTTSLKDSLYDAPRFNGKESLESTMQAGVAKVLGETFQAERELQEEQEKVKQKRQVAEDAVRESIDNRRHASEIKLFSNINNNISRLTTYQMNTGIAVQKKSLEISMRQYMLLGQMHQHQLTQGNIFQEQLKAIIKHTSLPDEAKVTMSDRFKDTMKSRAIGGVQDRMFANGSILTQGLSTLTKDAKNSISDFASQMEMLLSLGDAADMIFGEDAFESTPKTIGNLAGGAVTGWARNKLANPLGKKLSKIPGFEDGLAHIRRYAVNPNYGLEDLKKSDFWKKIQGTKLEGPLEAVFDTLKSAFKPGGYDTKLSSGLGLGQSLAPGSFTKRLEIVQTQVVPGYLARILQAVSSLKTKSKVPLLHFDPVTGSFKNESAIQKATETIIEREAQRANIGYQTKYIANEIGEKVGVAENDTMIIGRLMLELTKSSKPITPETITESLIYKKATSIEKKALDAVAFKISKSGAEGKNFIGDLEDNLASMRKSMPTHSAIMQQLVDDGRMEQLVKAKYASVDERGGLSLRPEAVDDLLEKSLRYNYKSDDEVDEYSRIKRQKVREAYEAQKTPGSAADELKAAFKIKKKPKNIDADVEKAVEEALKKKQNESMNVTPGSEQDDPEIGNSDKEMKSKFAAFDSKFALEGIQKTPVTSWNYKTDPSTDAKKVGPMSQDLHKNFGNFVAPDGKKINLISMNGINMAAIQGLAKRQDDMESRFKSEHGLDPNKKKQEFLLFAINENIIRLDKTLKDKTFGFSLEGIDTEALKNAGLDALGTVKDKSKETLDKAKVKASAIIKTGNYYIDTIQEIAVSGLNDLYGKGKQGKDFAVYKSQEFWANNKAAIKQKKDLFIEKSFEFYGKTLDFGRDVLFNQIPEKAKEAWEYLKEGKEKLKAIVSGPKDVYIKGSLSPVLRAERMRAGFYVDAETGMVIRSIDALLKIKGDVYDSGKKEVVLTRSDLADGVYDEKGTKLLTLKDTAMGLAIAGGQYLYDKASKGFDFLKKEGTSIAGKALEWWKDPSSIKEILKSTFTSVKDKFAGFQGMSFYDKRQITVLAQIRDLMAIGKQKKLVEHVYHRNLEDQSYLKGDGFLGMLGLKAKAEEAQGTPGADTPEGTPGTPEAADAPQGNSSVSSDKMAETFSKENIEKAIEKSKELKDKALNSPLGQKAKNTWLNSYLGKKITAAKNKKAGITEAVTPEETVSEKKPSWLAGKINAISGSLGRKSAKLKKGEKIVLEQNGVRIIQEPSGVYRQESYDSSQPKSLGTRIDDFYKKKTRERTLAGLINGSYTDLEMEGLQNQGELKGPVETLGKYSEMAKKKLQKTGDQIANSAIVQNTKDKAKQGLTNAAGFVKESGQQAVNLVGQLSKNPAFQTLMKGLVGFKETYTGEVQIGKNVPKESFSEGLLNKLKLQNMATQGQKSLDDKANSKWGRFKSDMAERAEAVTAPIADRWGRMKGRMGGKVGKAWEFAKSAGSMIGSGISAAGGFLKNMMGETVNERSNNDFGTALGSSTGPTGAIRGTGDGVKGKNDSDGDGERDGGSTEMLRSNREKETLRRQEESQKAQDAAKRAADSSLKYRSSENAIDRMMKGASGLIDYLKENAGSMFSTALNVLEMIPGVGKLLKLGRGAMTTVSKGVMTAGRWGLGKLGMVANGARAAFAAGGMKGVAASALSKAGTALNVARTVAMASGGVSGSIVGLGLTAAKTALAVLASPFVIKAALIAGAAYGIYKTYKYFTRNNADAFQKLRLVQYGFKEDHSQQHRIMALEDYFLDGRYTPHFGGSFIQQKLKEEEILEIMDIDPKDEKRKQSFYLWLNGRFKPFFLTHITAMYAADPKLKLQDASKLEFEALGKYLDKAQYLDGPYNVEESPFSVDEKVVNTSQDIPDMVEKLRHSKKKGKESGKSNVKAVSEDAKLSSNLNASKAEQAEEAKRQATLAAQGLADKKKETNSVLANTQANSSKGLVAPLTAAQVGEDANAPTSPTGKPSQTDGVKSVSIGTLPEAQGPLALDQDGTRFLHVKQGVNINNLHPNIRRYLSAMAAEYGKMTGNMIPITDGFRSYAEQAALYQRMPNKAAKPGFSMHEHGLAFDMDSKAANELDKLGLLRKYGFTRPVGGEPWHIEPAGVQLDIDRAKKDSGWASAQIEASPGRGGGGYGSQSGSTMKRRNPTYAAELWNASSTSKLTLAEKPGATAGSSVTATAAKAPGTTGETGSTPVASGGAASGGTVKGMTAPGQGSSELLAKNGASVGQVNQVLNSSTSNQQSEGESPPSPGGSADTPFKPKGTGVVEQTKEAAAAAAKKAGLDPSTLQLFAAVESSMGQKTNSGKSSAQGPFQFIPSTWRDVVKSHGQKYGVTPEDSPSDPYKSGLMTAAYMKENEPKIKKHKSTADIRDFYMAHMLGGSGVQTFLKMRPEDIPATMMPGAAKNNSSVFYKDYKNLKEPYTKSQVDEQLAQKFTKLGQAFGVPVNFGTSTTPANDSKATNNASTQGTSGSAGAVTAPMPTMPKQNGMMTASYQPTSNEPSSTPERSETSMFTNNQVEKRKPVETMRGDAGQASGMSSAIERSATASEQLLQSVQNDVVPVLRGMHETLLKMYQGKSDTVSKGDETTKTPTSRQGTTSAVSNSSLDRARKYGT